MKKILFYIIVICLCVFSLTGCSGTQGNPADLSSDSPAVMSSDAPVSAPSIRITDAMNREVLLEEPAQRVVLTFSFEEYFAVTGEDGVSKVVGWARKYWEGRRQSTWDVFVAKFPMLDSLPDVGYIPQSTFNVETVISLEPDLVLMVKNDFESAGTDLERLEAAGIPVLFVDYHTQTVESHCASTLMIGQAMGMEERARELTDFYREQVALVTQVISSQTDLARPKVYVEFSDAAGPDVFGASYGKLMWGAMVEQCGGENIARDLVEGASAAIMPEQVLAAGPEVILFAGNQYADSDLNIGLGYTSDQARAEENLAAYAGRPGWSELPAVRENRMYALYHDLSRHIFDFAGMQFFAKAIHPELFPALDPNAGLLEFHDRFYPVDYTGTWFAGLEESQ